LKAPVLRGVDHVEVEAADGVEVLAREGVAWAQAVEERV